MKIQELITYVKSLVPYAFYPFSFPKQAEDEAATITISAGSPADVNTGVSRPAVQILVRGKPRDFGNTEAKALEIYSSMANKKNQEIGGRSVVVIKPNGSSPFFIGSDENDRPIFSQNYSLVVRPQN